MPGKKPASAAPSKVRSMTYDEVPRAKAIATERTPHVIMIRAIHIRAPKRLSNKLLGTSQRK